MRKINFFTQSILRTLSSQFCAPFLITFHYYLRMLWCTYAHKTIWLYYSINFLPPQTYLLMLQTPNSKITNYWYKTYELLIQNLRTIDTNLTNYWYKTYELLIQNLRTGSTNHRKEPKRAEQGRKEPKRAEKGRKEPKRTKKNWIKRAEKGLKELDI